MPNEHQIHAELQFLYTLDQYRADLAVVQTIPVKDIRRAARRIRRQMVKAQRRAEGWSYGR